MDEAIRDVLTARLFAWPASVGVFEHPLCPGLKIIQARLCA
jgi:hypothetical protein